ncbi:MULTISPECIES: arginine repressor [Lachnoanaerobaculum]|jgi:arginine repressor, C-terminal domain protein|uniref:Arginine repressor n=2 Tax=Lachnoanaerobaculum TaxID=1164882 RepID=A0A133ZX04_9FIRM|nr:MULTISPECIES: arginine repressor ArgR [Lachnoanaerobaculum]EHO54745.1 arginine repressor protein [Lachnospiraceae bacterium oral taxon 082 str. F0431]MBF1010042.1 arginine repressor [Lachnoanaerobaculum sp.]MBS6727809.1 arginine repressor [Lachnospiraceae bacterium oral taxon 082]KXB59975.1 arginine repressor protein [Lachnoanaerobaculum saburreum]RRJ16182.1 arginine repressor [Lachnoanaerobaculum orale]
MKIKRHSKIIELINTYDIETQEELAQRLEDSGFVVTQATVSRDIRDLKLSKVVYGDGKQKYSLMPKQDGISEKYLKILKEAFISMDMAQNILVVKTVSGMAMAVAAALDSLQMSEIVGCIAGDDTIMAAIRSVDDTVTVMERIRKLIYKE